MDVEWKPRIGFAEIVQGGDGGAGEDPLLLPAPSGWTKRLFCPLL